MENRKTLKAVLKEVGIDRIHCKCGKTVNAVPAFEKVFDKIRELCKEGCEIHIRKFGIFRAVKTKARKMRSPVVGRICKVKSAWILKFYQTKAAKKLLNTRGNDGC